MSKYFYLFFLFFFFFFFVFQLGENLPPIWPDEVLFFSPTFDFFENYKFRTLVLKGIIEGMETYTFWMTPLSMLINSFLLNFSPEGKELWTLRFFSSIIGLISVFIFYLILGNFQLKQKQKLLLVYLVVFDILFLKVTHTARMESFCLFFSNLAIFFLTLRKQSFLSKFSTGFFLACAFLSHPFGIVFTVLSFFYSLKKKQFFYFHWFLGGMSILIFWIYYITLDFQLFLFQFGSQFQRKKELFTLFDQLTKFKILLGSFEFPTLKFILLFLIALGLLFNRKQLIKNELFQFSLVWFFTLLFFIYISTEFWYVVYLVFPLSILTSFLMFNKKWFFIFWLCLFFNLIPIFNNLFVLTSEQVAMKQNLFFNKIGEEVKNSQKIYIQSIPDPFFYLRNQFPEKELLEFIPNGVGIKDKIFNHTITNIDSFIFYNESLVHPLVLKYLEKNKNKFSRKKIYFPMKKEKIIRFFAIIYTKIK